MKKVLSLVLVLMLALSIVASASAELKGPGNVTLKRLGYTCPWDVNNDYMVPIMEESTGYKVDYYALPAEDALNKLVAEVSGGADYDVVNLEIAQWRVLQANGALMPLNELLNAYGQDILAGNSQEVWDALTGDDGEIYGVPYMYPHSSEISSFIVARKDLLEAAGITELPTTINQFYDMCVTLKNFYGDQYIILTGPLYAASETNQSKSIPRYITSAFGIYSDWMVDEDGKVIYYTEHKNYPAMMEFFAKMYKEGLLDPEWAANTEANIQEKFVSGKAILCCGSRALVNFTTTPQLANLGMDATTENMDKTLCYILPLSGEDGTCAFMESQSISKVSAILRNAKNPEDAMNWMNLKVKDQLYINIGVEGVHFTYDEKGDINPINPIFANERGDSYYYIDCTNMYDYEHQWPSRIRKSAGQWHAFNVATMSGTIKTCTNYFKFMPAAEAYNTNNPALFQAMSDFNLQLMAGVKTIDDIAAFNKEAANDYELEAIRAELQAYYDATYGK